jgi:DNA-binding response OmpR family regulator
MQRVVAEMRGTRRAATLASCLMNDHAFPLCPDDAGGVAPDRLRRVLLHDVEPALAGLIAEWLGADGFVADSDASRGEPPVALIVVDLPFPRQAGRDRLDALQRGWPGVPVVVLSPTLLPGVPPRGEVARALGAAAVLPSPLSRQSLRAAIETLLDGQRS